MFGCFLLTGKSRKPSLWVTFLSSCLYTHSQSWPQGIRVFLFGHSEVTKLLGLIIRTAVWLRLLTGVKEWRLPSLPHHHPSFSLHLPDSRQVLLFSPHHRLLRDESLAELNRHTCVTPGYRALPLISFLNWRPVLFLGSVLRSSSWKVHQKASGTTYWARTWTQVWLWQIILPSAGSSQLLPRKRQGEADSKTGRVFREQTEGSPYV